MASQILPVNSNPNQTFTTTLMIDGKNTSLTFFFNFNEQANYWCMSINNSLGVNLLSSIPIVPGDFPAANVLQQYVYLKIGSCYIIKTSDSDEQYPGISSLGTDWQLIWDDTPLY